MIRVVLADDQALIRAGFRALIDSSEDVEVIAEVANGEEAVAAARQYRPDVLLMDIRMPGIDGLEATRRIAADPGLGDTKVLVLTTYEVDEYIYDAIHAGASGFLLKDTEPTELLQAIRIVERGDALLAPSITRRLIGDIAAQPDARRKVASPALDALTPREREVLELIAQGLTNDEIATHLFLSPLTSKTHVSRILRKLRARDRAQLVVIAYESGLVSPGQAEEVQTLRAVPKTTRVLGGGGA